jgi:hypothetical protein
MSEPLDAPAGREVPVFVLRAGIFLGVTRRRRMQVSHSSLNSSIMADRLTGSKREQQ